MARTCWLAAPVLMLLLAAGCAAPGVMAPEPPDPAAERLAAGVLPQAVPPVPPEAALGVGRDYFLTGNFGYAARYFQQAVALRPDRAEAWLGLAAAYDRLRRFDLADRAYAEAEARAGGSAAFLNNVGYSSMLRGDFGRARRSLIRAQALEPDNATVANNLELLRRAASLPAAGA